jgi:hypothetical protein
MGLISVASVSFISRQLYGSHIDITAGKELKIMVFLSMNSKFHKNWFNRHQCRNTKKC